MANHTQHADNVLLNAAASLKAMLATLEAVLDLPEGEVEQETRLVIKEVCDDLYGGRSLAECYLKKDY
jgi:hypothetical protein